MDNMKYNEVIKALTRMSEEDPDGFSSEILGLINGMQREIETLKAHNEDLATNWTIICDRAEKRYAELYNEAKSVLVEKSKAEAVQKFAHELKILIEAQSILYSLGDEQVFAISQEAVEKAIDKLTEQMGCSSNNSSIPE